MKFRPKTPADLILVHNYHMSRSLIHYSHDEALQHAQKYAKLIDDDRRSGTSEDRTVFSYRHNWLTACLEQLSKQELIELIYYFVNEFISYKEELYKARNISKEKIDFDTELVRAIYDILNSRYLLRHPEEQ